MNSITQVCITGHGAVADGRTLNTRAIQAAIDHAAGPQGGGHVVVPRGRFRTGTLHLRSRMTLELRPGAVLEGSPDIADYEALQAGHNKDVQPYQLLKLDNLEDVRLAGPGRIDGNGPAFWHADPLPGGWFRELGPRPSPLIQCVDCRNLAIEGVQIAHSPGWTLHLKRCSNVRVHGIAILNNLFGPNTDGIDIDGCRDVRVSDCLIEAGDDAVVLKTTPDSQSCERVVVANCTIATNCRALKLGAHESFHDMRDVVFSGCVVRQCVAVVGIYCRNGGTLENVVAANIVGHAFSNPDFNQSIHIDLARRTPAARLGRIRNILLENMILHSSGPVLITGDPAQPVENVTLRNLQLHPARVHDPFPSGLTASGMQFSPAAPAARAARAAVVAENVSGLTVAGTGVVWPGSMPAPFHGFWGRNVQGGRVETDGLAASDASLATCHLEACSLRISGQPAGAA